MKELVKATQLPLIPEDWDYETSVNYVKPKIQQWKKLTYEIAYALYVANEVLSAQGRRTDLVTNVTKLPTFEQYCGEIGMTKMTAYRWMEAVFGKKQLTKPRPPKIESQVIYADPPWEFLNTGFNQSAEQQYPTMSLDEICWLTDDNNKPIKQATKGQKAILFLWVPEALLPEGLQVMKAWGFEYKANMVWVKDKSPGIGWWVKAKHEMLCIGCNESELYPQEKFESVFEAQVTEHSKKPERVYEMIEAMYTGPYIELFARNTRKGWTNWGNEIPEG